MYAAKNDFECLFLLPLPPEGCNHKCVHSPQITEGGGPTQGFVPLATEPLSEPTSGYVETYACAFVYTHV